MSNKTRMKNLLSFLGEIHYKPLVHLAIIIILVLQNSEYVYFFISVCALSELYCISIYLKQRDDKYEQKKGGEV